MEHTKTIQEVNYEVCNAPTGPILDMLAKAVSVTWRRQKIMVSVSGGSDSDIVVDVIDRVDAKGKATFVFFNTGLEYDATKRHLTYMEEKYGIKIQEVPPVLPIPACCRRYGVPFWSKRVSEMIYRLQRHEFQWMSHSRFYITGTQNVKRLSGGGVTSGQEKKTEPCRSSI